MCRGGFYIPIWAIPIVFVAQGGRAAVEGVKHGASLADKQLAKTAQDIDKTVTMVHKQVVLGSSSISRRIAIDPNNVALYLERALQYLKEGNAPGAIDDANYYIAHEGKRVDAFVLLVRTG